MRKILLLLALLVGCANGGVYRTLYGDGIVRYDIAPVTAEGRLCYAGCRQAEDTCRLAEHWADRCVEEAVACFRACPGIEEYPVCAWFYQPVRTPEGGWRCDPVTLPERSRWQGPPTGSIAECAQACEDMGRGSECHDTCHRLYHE